MSETLKLSPRLAPGAIVLSPRAGGGAVRVEGAGSALQLALVPIMRGEPGGQYTHTQATASTTWTINHNLGYRPAVSLLTVGGMQMIAEVLHVSANQAQALFDSPVAGLAVCS